MIFSMEALRARKGDCLILHCGRNAKPDLYLIDGGPRGVYGPFLKERLEQLRAKKDPVDIRLLMVSHTDDDHVRGVLDLTAELRQREQLHEPLPYRIRNLWHNSFDDVIGNSAETLQSQALKRLALASSDDIPSLDIPLKEEGAAMALASVGQGRNLRQDAKLLNLPVNRPGNGGVLIAGTTPLAGPFTQGVDIHLLGPTASLIEEYRKEWDKYLQKKGLDIKQASVDLAEYLDKSAFNLASIVALVQAGGKEILLTGDARGDFVLQALKKAELLKRKGRHLDILKVPHHGSSRNVDVDVFQALPANHYVISGDGEHGNPDIETLEMIFEARKDDDKPFTLHFTYDPATFKADSKTNKKWPLAKYKKLIKDQQDAGREFSVNFPADGELGLRIDLLDPYTGP